MADTRTTRRALGAKSSGVTANGSDGVGNEPLGLLQLDAPAWALWVLGTVFGMVTVTAFLMWGAGGASNLWDAIIVICT